MDTTDELIALLQQVNHWKNVRVKGENGEDRIVVDFELDQEEGELVLITVPESQVTL